jgi:cell wall-associated NlpC family hydrolase
MAYTQELKDAINRVTYLKGARERALDIGDQDLLKWADNELLKPYDYIRNESRGDYELIRNNPYSELQQYNARVQAEPAYVSPPRVEMPNPNGGLRKNSAPVIEMLKPYKRYDNIGSKGLTAGATRVKMPAPNVSMAEVVESDYPTYKVPTLAEQRLKDEPDGVINTQGNKLPGWLEKAARLLKPIARVKPSEPQPPVSPGPSANAESVYVDSRPKHGTFSKAWLRDGFTPKGDSPQARVLTPEDEPVHLDWSRRDLVDTAMSLEGLPYFWGGKHPHVGLNPEWMSIREVTSPYSRTTGQRIAYGLDCSGFVDWVYDQVLLPLGYKLSTNGGTDSEFKNMKTISRDEHRPGDVAFQYTVTEKDGKKTVKIPHVGIYLGKDEAGNNLYIHAYGGEPVGDFEGGIIKISTYNDFNIFKRPNVVFKDDQ